MLLYLEILWPAILVGFLVLLTHIPLGQEVLSRGIIFLDLAIAQIAAFGVVLSSTLWFHHEPSFLQTGIAIAAALLGSLGFFSLRSFPVRIQEAMIGVFFVLSATGSILALSADPHGGERLKAMLVGQVLWLRGQELMLLAGAYIGVLLVWFAFKARWGDGLFYPVFAVTITLSTQYVGVYLVFASLIIPALVTLNQSRAYLKSLLIGSMGYFLGLLASVILDFPAGAAIVWALAFVGAIYYVFAVMLKKKFSTD